MQLLIIYVGTALFHHLKMYIQSENIILHVNAEYIG